ncbi:hypothetical protein DM02DRAFT_316397 [Periconia macrospinosa]|uniref:Secreted protein n=1 Tax=Periconia macrospinosa TaxID=97972 RepID=A0A2V1D2A9_9PLEO|nr:hypothetical protein DM02DRAFT_316397 [Periconia macrospinosa]
MKAPHACALWLTCLVYIRVFDAGNSMSTSTVRRPALPRLSEASDTRRNHLLSSHQQSMGSGKFVRTGAVILFERLRPRPLGGARVPRPPKRLEHSARRPSFAPTGCRSLVVGQLVQVCP